MIRLFAKFILLLTLLHSCKNDPFYTMEIDQGRVIEVDISSSKVVLELSEIETVGFDLSNFYDNSKLKKIQIDDVLVKERNSYEIKALRNGKVKYYINQ